jgi:hypothetical protein
MLLSLGIATQFASPSLADTTPDDSSLNTPAPAEEEHQPSETSPVFVSFAIGTEIIQIAHDPVSVSQYHEYYTSTHPEEANSSSSQTTPSQNSLPKTNFTEKKMAKYIDWKNQSLPADSPNQYTLPTKEELQEALHQDLIAPSTCGEFIQGASDPNTIDLFCCESSTVDLEHPEGTMRLVLRSRYKDVSRTDSSSNDTPNQPQQKPTTSDDPVSVTQGKKNINAMTQTEKIALGATAAVVITGVFVYLVFPDIILFCYLDAQLVGGYIVI